MNCECNFTLGVNFKCIAEGSRKSLAVGREVPTLRKLREEWGTHDCGGGSKILQLAAFLKGGHPAITTSWLGGILSVMGIFHQSTSLSLNPACLSVSNFTV